MDGIATNDLPGLRRRSRLTLGAYLAFAFSGLSVVLTVIIAFVIERTAAEGVAGSIGANLAELASQTANRLDRGMFERYREIQLMSGRLARIRDPELVQVELDEAKRSFRHYAWLGVVDPKGIVQAASGGLLQGADVSQRPWFGRALAGVHLGDVHEAVLLAKLLGPQGDGAPARFYDVAFPIRQGGQVTGVLGAHVSWEWARDVRQAVFGPGRGKHVEPMIVAADGTVLLGPQGTEGQRLQLGSLDRAARGDNGYATEQWPGGGTYLVGYSGSRGFESSPGLGWRVLVRQDVASAYQPLRMLQRRVAFGGIALAIVFSMVGWLAARAVTRPLLALADEARRLERGGDGEVPTSHAYREVEVLGHALNSLLGTVQQKTAELHALNTGLEQRVEQRTAELRDAFERVRANEQRTQTIIEAAQDPFIGMDLEGRITDWNTQAEVVFGWGREEVMGQRVSGLLLPPRFQAGFDAALQGFLQTGAANMPMNRPIERLMVDRAGRELPVEVKIGLVSTGRERFFTAFVHDISQRKEIERLKDEFVSTVSHELRTPLTAIYGSLNLLNSGMAGELPPDAKQLLAISHESTERLIRLINDMLDLEKIASGKIEYRMLPQQLRPLVEQAVRDTDAYAEGLRVRFRLAEGGDARVLADADRIVQVCVNLLSNAAKFSPAGSVVEVAVARSAGMARVAVVDRGPGVPQEFRDRMFERFAQADGSDGRAKGGTGLGLAICRSIVEAHEGRIGFDSEPGARTEFWFELPLA